MILQSSFGQPTLWQRVRPWFSGFDPLLLLAILALASIGLTAMYSAGFDNGSRFMLQVRNMALAGAVFFLVSQVPPQRFMALAVPLYTVGVILLILTALFGIDPTHKGARRWLNVGVVIQPSEILKIATPLMVAWWFQRREGRPRTGDIAQAVHDANQATIAAYNSFSPQTAVGVGLSNVVKINHIARLVATKSQVNLTITGQAGTTIVDGIAGDTDGNQWLLPGSVVVPPAGFIIVTASAKEAGAVAAGVGAVTRIITPTAGWQSVTNATAAVPGQPIESDAELRARQVISPAINANTVLTGLAAAIKALPGVTYGTVYENDTGVVDSNGLPAHSISLVVQGGDATDIATTIYNRKAPGVATHGSTTISVTDVSGALRDIKFYIPTEVAIKVAVSLYPGDNYTTATATAIKQAIVNHINALDIGEDLIALRLMVPAMLTPW